MSFNFFLGGLFDTLQARSPMLGRFWLLLMLVFRMLILGTVASDLFEDEQGEFACNTLQPGCKFWVFHIVLIATPSLLFLMYATHHHNKRNDNSKCSQIGSQDSREDRHFRKLYIVNVTFRIVAEVGFLVGQWLLYGFKVEAQFPCSRFPCPYTVDCFTSRPAEKTIFLCFYFCVGVLSAISSIAELVYISMKWFCVDPELSLSVDHPCVCQNLQNVRHEDVESEEQKPSWKTVSETKSSSVKPMKGFQRSSRSRKVSNLSYKHRSGKYSNSRTLSTPKNNCSNAFFEGVKCFFFFCCCIQTLFD
uniref:Gap junction protein delta 3 n=1 Tax=Gouania willdenowi TaxID=441366 RepID=A0A8C5N7L6_GOUWI